MGNSLWRWFRKDCNHFLLQAVNLQIIFSNLQHCWATHTFFCSFYQSHCQLMWDLCQVIMANRRTGDFILYRTPLFSHIVLFEKKKNSILYSFEWKDWGQLSFKWIPPFFTCFFFCFWRVIFSSVPWYWVSFWRIPLPLHLFLFPYFPFATFWYRNSLWCSMQFQAMSRFSSISVSHY